MKKTQIYALLGISFLFAVSCKSTKNVATSASNQNTERKKDPVAVETAVRMGNMLDKLATDLRGVLNNNVESVRTAEGINITFQPIFTFDSNSDELIGDAKGNLDKITGVLNRYPYTEIFVEGHADSSGNQLKNKKLSELRARNVAVYLKNHGVKADKLAIAGYGATRPVASNATPEGRKLNRRIVVKIRANEKEFLESEKANGVKPNEVEKNR